MSIAALICVAIAVLIYWLRDYLRAVSISMRLRGPPVIPFVGHATLLLKPEFLSDFVAPANRLYGRVARAWLFTVPLFVVTEPNDIQAILASSKHTDKIFVYRFMHNFLGNGLITSSGEKWRKHRQLLQPMFSQYLLKHFLSGFANAANRLVEAIEPHENIDLNMTPFINDCVLEVLNEAVFGVRTTNLIQPSDTPFRKGKLMMPYRLIHPWLLVDWVYSLTRQSSTEAKQKQSLNSFTQNMIAERQKDLGNGHNPKCLLDNLIQLSLKTPTFTHNDIVEEAETLMLAGQDSVGSAVAFCLFMLAQYQDCQKRCQQEIDSMFRFKNVPDIDDIRGLTYLDQCLKETLRMYPSIPLIARRISEPVRINDIVLPVGSNVLIFPYATHRIEQIFPNPDTFDPSRFKRQAAGALHPFAYIPFSAGPRNCIGLKFANLEMLTIIANVLHSFDVYPVSGRNEAKPVFRVSLRASGGLWVRFKLRKC